MDAYKQLLTLLDTIGRLDAAAANGGSYTVELSDDTDRAFRIVRDLMQERD